LTDHDPDIAALLRRRAFELYRWTPAGEAEPGRPAGCALLSWAEPLPAVSELEPVLRRRLQAQSKCTAARIARDIGWTYSGFARDSQLAAPE
jgi:hypothetical protein